MDLFGSASRFRWPAPRHPRVRRPGHSSSGSGSFGEPRRQGVQGFPKATYSSNNATPKMTKKIVATDIWTKMLTGKAQSCFLSPSFTFINLQNDVFFNGWSFFFQNSPTWIHTKTKIVPFQRRSPFKKRGNHRPFPLSLSLSLEITAVTYKTTLFFSPFASLGGLKSSCPRMEEAFTLLRIGFPKSTQKRLIGWGSSSF